MAKGQKQAITFDRYCKNAKHRFHQQTYSYYKLRNGGVEWGYLVVINYQSLVSNFFPLAPPPFIFLYKDRRNRLLCVSFLELYDFMIYQHVNKRAQILPLATFHTAHLCKQFNQVCITISMPRSKSIIFYQNSRKIKLFLKKKCKIFKR